MARKRVRSRDFVPYTDTNWVIGDPASYLSETRRAQSAERVTESAISARFAGACAVCERPIRIGSCICRALVNDKGERWVHAECSHGRFPTSADADEWREADRAVWSAQEYELGARGRQRRRWW